MFSFLNRKKFSSLSDEELILFYKKDASNIYIDIIYKRYGHLLLAIAFKYLKTREDAQDVVMSLFEQLGQKLQRHEIQNFKSWIHSTIKNECLMHLRKTKKINSNMSIEQLESVCSEFEQQEIKETKEKILIALENSLLELKTEQQECIRLFYLENKSYVDIAECMNLSLNNVKSAIQNGKRMLKIKLENKGVNLTGL